MAEKAETVNEAVTEAVDSAMSREEVLAYVQKEFGTRLKAAKLEAEDSPTSFSYVIDDALNGGGTLVTIKARANYYTLLRLRDGLAHQGATAPKNLAEEIEGAQAKVIAAYPKGDNN